MNTVGYKKKGEEGISFYFLIHFTWQVGEEAVPAGQGETKFVRIKWKGGAGWTTVVYNALPSIDMRYFLLSQSPQAVFDTAGEK